MESGANRTATKVWDLPLRISHWLIAILVTFSWWSAENDRMDWHMWSGYALLGTLVFRIYWGFAGSTTARFSHFIHGPRSVWRYTRRLLQRPGQIWLGHNPLGGWSSLLLLLTLGAQVTLGLYAEDVDGLASGPLAFTVSYDTGRWAAETHEDFFNVLLTLIIIHIAAILFYWIYRRTNLVGPMFSGRLSARTKGVAQAEDIYMAPLWMAIPGLILAGLFLWWILTAF